ncbi:DUF5103 domain-containing protein [Barnesiella sp. An55]|uniref:type IX secretion system plug protein n=1 Tax=Barnesiella sp. An55 TaxID=1965646 RepID=UPI000B37C382|nr:DUF5103 domain-containing protein [Barnesiella sp. An55]OUN74390.1 DUF5103 domain-containing protein [Barnesiella sp. An55]HIZ27209.1 DUF5103 domain-containing protein [Candidatus Barnesiella merdipullorum]
MKLTHILYSLVTVAFLSCPLASWGQNLPNQPYETRAFSDRFRTLRTEVEGRDLFPPIIELNSNEHITISFDEMTEEASYLQYSIVHCNADWRPSALSELEYLDGFNTNSIDNFDFSMATFAHYVHYSLTLPNEDVQFKVSGNYVLLVYPENEPEHILLQVCFSVYENDILVAPSVTSRTDIDYNREHQQVSVTLNANNYRIQNPYTELKVSVTPNSRRDQEVIVTRPLRVQGSQVIFDHDRNLIFEAGNEFRRFEMVATRYAGLGVKNIYHFDPYYHVVLTTSEPRAETSYLYDKTQNGRFVIRQSGANDSDTEADYFVVHFTLDSDPISGGKVYIDGDLTNHLYTPSNEMVYNPQSGQYEKTLFLKQGSYNYQYVFLPDGASSATAAPIEGNYYQTVNEYLVKVYHRPQSERYDKLIGFGMCYSGR